MKHLIDVRSPAEFQSGHAPGARNVPVDQLAIRLSSEKCELDKSDNIDVYCQAGGRAGVALSLLERAGFKNLRNLGGIADVLAS